LLPRQPRSGGKVVLALSLAIASALVAQQIAAWLR